MPTLPDKFLQQDLTAVTHPDINRPFQSKEDVFARLAPFHIFNSPQPEFEKSEGGEKVFEGVRLAEEALRNFHKRLKQEEESTHHRHVSEKAFLYGLGIQQEQAAKREAIQKATLAQSGSQMKTEPKSISVSHPSNIYFNPSTNLPITHPVPVSSQNIPQSGWIQTSNAPVQTQSIVAKSNPPP